MNTKGDSNELVVLLRVPSELVAAPIVAELEANGIRVSMTGGFTAGFIAEAPGDVQIVVLKRELKTAIKILANFKSNAPDIDWDEIDVGDPP